MIRRSEDTYKALLSHFRLRGGRLYTPEVLHYVDCCIYFLFSIGSIWKVVSVRVAKIALSKLTGYNKTMNWNTLYPSNDNASSLEDAIREAEWEDDMRQSEQEWGEKYS